MLNLVLVEDNPADRALLQLLLKETGINYSLKIFHNGEDAINYFDSETQNSQNPPSGIVLDLNIPKKSGFEVLQFIRSNKDLNNIPVAILSSSTDIDDRQRVEKANGYFFSKSFKLPEMKATVSQIIHLFQ